jgi:hypothetical protein
MSRECTEQITQEKQNTNKTKRTKNKRERTNRIAVILKSEACVSYLRRYFIINSLHFARRHTQDTPRQLQKEQSEEQTEENTNSTGMENVGRPVRVYWENEDDWYTGFVENFVPDKGFHIQYHDGDEEWLATLQGVEFEDEDPDNTGNQEHKESTYGDTCDEEDFGAAEEIQLGNTLQHTSIYDQEADERLDGTTLRSLSVSPVSSPKRSTHRDRGERESFQSMGDRDESAGVQHASVMEGEELGFQSSLHSTKELNTNGVLLKGEVLGANNLPLSQDQEQGAGAAGVFYRVLYAEGGDESSMFRCKTPIYKSEVAFDLEFPRWEADKKFRFEMILPGDESLEESDFSDHGDMIVAVYRSRANGGSDFVGQVCIQLQDFIRVGTVGRARPSSHCRLLKGCFPLISRHGDIVGGGLADVDIDVSLEWRLVDKPAASLKTRSAIEEITARNKQQAMKGSGSVKGGDKRLKSGRSGVTNSGKTSSAAMSSLKASRRSRQQTVLDAQNEKLRSRLLSAGPKQAKRPAAPGHKKSDNSTVSEIYRPVDRTADKKKAFVKRDKGSKDSDKKRSGTTTASRSVNLNLSHEDLVIEYETLKKKVGEAQLELRSLQTMDSKLKAQVIKNEAVTGRLKKIELNNRKKSSLESFSKAEGEAPKGSSDSSFYSVKNLLLRAGIEEDEDQLGDELLRERLAEHSILQDARIGCLERIERAKQLHGKDESRLKKCILDIEQKCRELESRASKIDKPKNDWNLHVLSKESKIMSLRTEVSQLNMIRKLNLDPELSKYFDDGLFISVCII